MKCVFAFAARIPEQTFERAAVFSIGLVVALLATAANALAFTNLIVLSDSIVDQGKTQAAAVGKGFPDPAPAFAGYCGWRFTNG